MITARDIDYHHGNEVDHEWAETNFFGFYIPEERLLGSIYTVARAGTGACASEFIVYRGLSQDRMNVVHYDVQEHLPLPKSLADYRLPNGMQVRAVNAPRDYRIEYTGREGTELKLDYTGLMEPFDIHDASQNVRAAKTDSARAAGSSFGEAYKGHFDQTSHATGSLKLGGRTFAIDCIDTMDHSWGPRPEYGMKSQCWLHGHFGPDLVVHLILSFKPWAAREQQYELAHGYVLRDGAVHAVTRATVVADRVNLQGIAMSVDVTDCTGRSVSMRGGAIAGGAWPAYLTLHTHNTLHQWTTDSGQLGYGVVQENWPMDKIAARNLAAMLGTPA